MVGARQSVVREIAAVEDISAFVEPACGRFFARAISDPQRARIPDAGDYEGTLCMGGPCWRAVIEECDLQVGGEASKGQWEEAVEMYGGSNMLLYSDGSHDDMERVSGGW